MLREEMETSVSQKNALTAMSFASDTAHSSDYSALHNAHGIPSELQRGCEGNSLDAGTLHSEGIPLLSLLQKCPDLLILKTYESWNSAEICETLSFSSFVFKLKEESPGDL